MVTFSTSFCINAFGIGLIRVSIGFFYSLSLGLDFSFYAFFLTEVFSNGYLTSKFALFSDFSIYGLFGITTCLV